MEYLLPFARALAGHGFQVFIHEWRGAGSSSLRASRHCDWGYRELLEEDLADDWFVPEPSVTRLTAKLAKCRVTRQVLDARAVDGKADHYGWMKAPGAIAAEITRWAREHAG